MTTAQTATRMDVIPQAIAPQRQLKPLNGKRNVFGSRNMPPDRLAVFASIVRRDPLANASKRNSELCMQDFL